MFNVILNIQPHTPWLPLQTNSRKSVGNSSWSTQCWILNVCWRSKKQWKMARTSTTINTHTLSSCKPQALIRPDVAMATRCVVACDCPRDQITATGTNMTSRNKRSTMMLQALSRTLTLSNCVTLASDILDQQQSHIRIVCLFVWLGFNGTYSTNVRDHQLQFIVP